MVPRVLPLLRRPRGASFSSSSSPTVEAAAAAGKILETGSVLRLSRRFSEADVLAYSKVSGDTNPLHFEPEVASEVAGFLGPIVHGMLVASLFPCIIASHFPGAVYVSQTLHFRSPVYIDEEIVAEIQPVGIREIKKRFMYTPRLPSISLVFLFFSSDCSASLTLLLNPSHQREAHDQVLHGRRGEARSRRRRHGDPADLDVEITADELTAIIIVVVVVENLAPEEEF